MNKHREMEEDSKLNEMYEEAIWTARSLFDRGKTSGSSANLSFLYEGRIYITGSGTCFGRLTKQDFSVLDSDGTWISGKKPSKEFPMHRLLYAKSARIKAVLHTHSLYATLWSCLEHAQTEDIIPDYTPYLKMRLGTVGLIPYAPPGSEELFRLFEMNMKKSNGYLLKNHGPIVGAKSIMEAFYCMEELEESARIAWELEK